MSKSTIPQKNKGDADLETFGCVFLSLTNLVRQHPELLQQNLNILQDTKHVVPEGGQGPDPDQITHIKRLTVLLSLYCENRLRVAEEHAQDSRLKKIGISLDDASSEARQESLTKCSSEMMLLQEAAREYNNAATTSTAAAAEKYDPSEWSSNDMSTEAEACIPLGNPQIRKYCIAENFVRRFRYEPSAYLRRL